ncbi:potassium channel family protein [Euzebya tangerina]|uniref:potassium channel family protein n=1 Tax=Euzebya tangerina TaxID=591198 RepID=UPI000E319481|nr:NAD-binding protein [Euzebya tangerina]
MLKSLGQTLAQLTQRLSRTDDLVVVPDEVEQARRGRRQRTVITLLSIFLALVAVFSAAFHELMALEGRSFSWPTSVYWTLTTMTTLGFGDITFESDAGRLFSVVVLLSGSTFLLVVLPFVFIQFVFIPWMDERDRRRAPRSVPTSVTGHIILTQLGPVEESLIEDANQADVPYVVIAEDLDEAGRLHDRGQTVMVGPLDDPETWRRARTEHAALVVATSSDETNTNVAFTVREVAPDIRIVASANKAASVDILEISGADHVFQLGEVLGRAMAIRALGLGGHTSVIGEFAGLQVAEAGVHGTELAGRTLAELGLRTRLGVGLIGVWDRGEFEIATGGSVLHESALLLMAGTHDELAAFDAAYAVETGSAPSAVVIGGGRVGRSSARNLQDEGVQVTIVEQMTDRTSADLSYVVGDAADREVLAEAGIDDAEALLVTTHDDDTNVYLTRYLRGLRPDARIISRSRLDRNVSTLYRAGADAVLSYASTGSAVIWNQFRSDETLLVAHGLNVFRSPVPSELAGCTLADSHLHRRTGCNVVAVQLGEEIHANPAPDEPLPAGGELVLVGTDADKARFPTVFPNARSRARFRLGPGSR